MERYVIVIPAGTSAYLLPCDDGDICRLETLQRLVDGPIETADSCLDASWAREEVDSIKLIVNEEGLLRGLAPNERATELYKWNFTSSIVGTAVLMAARGDELIGFTLPVCKTICTEWELLPLQQAEKGPAGRECRFETFSPD